ncbi:Pyridoxal 5'-phosphate synthase subunit snz1 [Coemansia sp. RSA 2531]|nr:Pyridoxal 5'-phosphate synthase subunit snz1 [Coemansia sp. RSA 2531]
MPTKAEKERAARIAARQEEAKKKQAEKDAKTAVIIKNINDNLKITVPERAKMLNGRIIVDVINVVQAQLAQATGYAAVCALEALPAVLNTRKMSRLCDPRVTRDIANSVLIPVVAKFSIGHDIEAEVAIESGANFIDESEFAIGGTLSTLYVENKGDLPVPVICGVASLTECLLRRKEGASILRIKNNSAVRVDATVVILNNIAKDVAKYQDKAEREPWLESLGLKESDFAFLLGAKNIAPLRLFAYGGICTPRDVALMMHMHCAGVFVDNSVFTSDNPRRRLRAMAQAVKDYDKIEKLIELSIGTAERIV